MLLSRRGTNNSLKKGTTDISWLSFVTAWSLLHSVHAVFLHISSFYKDFAEILHISSYFHWPKAKQDIFLYKYPFSYLIKSVLSSSSFATLTARGVTMSNNVTGRTTKCVIIMVIRPSLFSTHSLALTHFSILSLALCLSSKTKQEPFNNVMHLSVGDILWSWKQTCYREKLNIKPNQTSTVWQGT